MKRRGLTFLLLAAIVVATAGPLAPANAKPGQTSRLSSSSSGAQANGPTPAISVPDTTSPDLCLDGLTIAFSSDASNLVAGDTNNVADVFVRSTTSSKIVRASVTPSGAQANGASYSPSLSVDGRWLAFASEATNLVLTDTNGKADIFLKDMKTHSIRRISVTSEERPSNGASNSPFVSLFGEYVTFESDATNLTPGDTNGLSDAFFRSVKTGTTTRLTAPAVGQDELAPAREKVWTAHARVSYEGRYVVFTRGATRTSQDRPTSLDVFLLDRKTGKLTMIDVAAWAGSFPTMNEEPVISADGRYVAFTSWSVWNNDLTVSRAAQMPSPWRNDDALARNDFDFKDIWYYDRISKTVVPMSSNPLGPVGNGDNYKPSISADGHQIAFLSDASNLVPGDTNGVTDVYVRDQEERTTSRVSLGGAGSEVSAASLRPSISYEGKRVAFASSAAGLVSGDTNLSSDVFLRNRLTDTKNRAPVLTAPFKGQRALSQGQEVSFTLRARDADGDPLRFAFILGAPSGATLDPLTGVFHWTAGPDPAVYAARTDAAYIADTARNHSDVSGGRCVGIVFWVADPRGASSFALAKYFVRDAERTLRCDRLGSACYVPDCDKR